MNQATQPISGTACHEQPLGKRMRPVIDFALRSGIMTLSVVGIFLGVLRAQNYEASTGVPTYSTTYPAEMGSVDVATGNLHLEIPLGSYPQRAGSTAALRLVYNSHMWTVDSDGMAPTWVDWDNNHVAFYLGDAWGLLAPAGSNGTYETDSNCVFDYHAWDPNGTQHWFAINLGTGTVGAGCSIKTPVTTYATDASGISVTATWIGYYDVAFQEYEPDGTCLFGECFGSDTGSIPQDTNGNYMLGGEGVIGNQVEMSVTDTLQRQVVSNGTGASCTFASKSGLFYPECLYVTTSTSTTSPSTQSLYTITYADIPLNTDFQQSGVTECTTSDDCMATVITSIVQPDGTQYTFTYDCYLAGNTACNSPESLGVYYGTVTSMTLPTGATVTYGYINSADNNGNMSRWGWRLRQRYLPFNESLL